MLPDCTFNEHVWVKIRLIGGDILLAGCTDYLPTPHKWSTINCTFS